MTVIFILLILSLLIAIGFLGAFTWAVKSGQYEDAETPSMRVLAEEDEVKDRGPSTVDSGPEEGGENA